MSPRGGCTRGNVQFVYDIKVLQRRVKFLFLTFLNLNKNMWHWSVTGSSGETGSASSSKLPSLTKVECSFHLRAAATFLSFNKVSLLWNAACQTNYCSLKKQSLEDPGTLTPVQAASGSLHSTVSWNRRQRWHPETSRASTHTGPSSLYVRQLC